MLIEKRLYIVFMAIFALALFTNSFAEPIGTGPDEETMANVARKVYSSVVKVEAIDGFKKVATGVVIDKVGYIVTTALLSPRDEKIVVTTAEGKRSDAKFLGMDPETHLALIKTEEKNLQPIAWGKAGDLVPGSWIGVISISPENTPAVTQGIVNSIAEDKIRLNVWVTRGASGSPVVNKDGQMVGLLRGVYSEEAPVVFEFREREQVASGYVVSRAEAPSSGMALAIPADIVRTVTSEIKEKGRVERGWLGVSFTKNEEGRLEIVEVQDESPAKLAQLQEGDIILKIDGKEVASGPMFVSEIRSRKPGQDVKLEIEREGKAREIKVKLGVYPEEEARRELELRFPRLFPPKPPKLAEPFRPPAMPEYRELFRWEKRKYIGVYLEEISQELLDYFGVKEKSGLLVSKVTEGTPAEKAGLKVGDVIVKVDGKTVDSVSRLSGLIQDKKKGDKIKLDLVREKKPMSLEVEIEEEESRGLLTFRDQESYRESWEEYNKELEQQWQKSQEQLKKYSGEMQERMKKLNEELKLKTKEVTVRARDAAGKLRFVREKDRVLYRV